MTGSTEDGRVFPANVNLRCESAVLERGPHVPQLQPARFGRDRRQRPVLLLRAITGWRKKPVWRDDRLG
jgi:hypothetical protein